MWTTKNFIENQPKIGTKRFELQNLVPFFTEVFIELHEGMSIKDIWSEKSDVRDVYLSINSFYLLISCQASNRDIDLI